MSEPFTAIEGYLVIIDQEIIIATSRFVDFIIILNQDTGLGNKKNTIRFRI